MVRLLIYLKVDWFNVNGSYGASLNYYYVLYLRGRLWWIHTFLLYPTLGARIFASAYNWLPVNPNWLMIVDVFFLLSISSPAMIVMSCGFLALVHPRCGQMLFSETC